MTFWTRCFCVLKDAGCTIQNTGRLVDFSHRCRYRLPPSTVLWPLKCCSVIFCLPDVLPNLVKLALLRSSSTQSIHLFDGLPLDLFSTWLPLINSSGDSFILHTYHHMSKPLQSSFLNSVAQKCFLHSLFDLIVCDFVSVAVFFSAIGFPRRQAFSLYLWW